MRDVQRLLRVLAVLMLILASGPTTHAQNRPARARDGGDAAGSARAPAENPGVATPKLPPRQDADVITDDQVVIHLSYFAGTRGKKTVPILMLHGWNGPVGAGKRGDLFALAQALQRRGHGVAVPDLRGHGQSVIRQAQGERSVRLDRDSFRPQDFRDMRRDIEAVRSYLLSEHNQGKLNLDALCVVGFEMGSVIALDWIRYDWSIPSFPTLKQGQDVKAFVLVSPRQSFRGAVIRHALASEVVRRDLSAMVIYGRKSGTAKDAKRITSILRRSHRRIADDDPDADRLRDLYDVQLETSLEGAKLLGVPAFRLAEQIDEFIQRRLVDRMESFAWRDRSLP